MGCESLDDSIPTLLECSYPLFQLVVLLLPLFLGRSKLGSGWGSCDVVACRDRGEADAGSKKAVLLFEFGNAALEELKLGFAPVSRVLSCDTVAVRPGLLAFLGRCFCTGSLP